jgi:undecaprenyl-diphosphatase
LQVGAEAPSVNTSTGRPRTAARSCSRAITSSNVRLLVSAARIANQDREVLSPDYSRVVAKVVTLLDALLVWDSVARTWIVAHHHPAIDVLMVGLSIMGRAGTVWLAITLVLIILDRRHLRAGARVVVALLLAYAVTDGLIKPLVARTRPFELPTATRVIDRRPATYSFPSGHAAASVAAALTLTHVWPRGRPVLWLLALLVSFSRIYVGVHYPLDVIGGALVGLACAWAAGRLILPRSR